ncbi:MAG: Glu/Leu/Phe/Val dehydrogenase dimerization domain-containing protein, partial [Steroidobacteraceae bacterium]
MNLFEAMSVEGHEQIVHFSDPGSALKCIVGIHSTALGPALGGLRMWTYAREADAERDVLESSRAMTYKTALAGLNLGGGKAVIVGDPEKDKSEALLRALGRFIDSLGRRFIVTDDVGTNVNDMDCIREETPHVLGVHPVHGGSGDPSAFTALGTLHGIRACLERRFGHEEIARASYAVQG